MPDPRDFIDAQSPAVGDALAEMARIVLAGGGTLHPGLTMRERAGAMAVLCADLPGTASDQPLFEVPREMLVSVDGARWQTTSDVLVLGEAPPGLNSLQRELLDLHVALYNACGKLAQTRAAHPRLALAGESDLLAALQALRPGFSVAVEASDDEAVPPAVSVFLGTRVFGLAPLDSDGDPTDQPAAPRQRVLMTLIDLLNHHPGGAPLRVDARAMTPAVARPTGTTECFANYGHRRDSLDLAITYCYVDTATPYVHCPPLTVDLPDSGTLTVKATRPFRKAPYGHIDPPRVTVDEDGLTLSHLTFRPPTAGRWDLPVVMALQSRALQQGADLAAAHGAGREGAQLLVDHVTGLLAGLRDTAAERAGANAAAEVLRGAADHQLALMRQCGPAADR